MSIQKIPNELIANLIPLNALSDEDRKTILQNARLDNIDKGKRIPAKNGKNWHSYLIDGSVDLIGQETIRESLNSQSNPERMREPIFSELHNTDIEYAVTIQPVQLLSVPRKALEKLTDPADWVEETPINPVESEMLNQLFQAINTGQLELPSMPEVAIRIGSLSNNPDLGPSDIAKVVQTDPSLAARIIQATNSAAYRGVRQVNTIREAITRLGLIQSQNLAMSIALQGAFFSHSAQIMAYMRQNWDQSVGVSATAYVIAKHTQHIEPDRALLGGLVHRIGAIPLLLFLEKSSAADDVIIEAVNRFTPMVGGLVLQEWGFEKDFIQVSEASENWTRDSGSRADLTDVILAARFYENLQSPSPLTTPTIDEVPAFRKLGLGTLESDDTLRILEDAKEEINSIKEFLN